MSVFLVGRQRHWSSSMDSFFFCPNSFSSRSLMSSFQMRSQLSVTLLPLSFFSLLACQQAYFFFSLSLPLKSSCNVWIKKVVYYLYDVIILIVVSLRVFEKGSMAWIRCCVRSKIRWILQIYSIMQVSFFSGLELVGT